VFLHKLFITGKNHRGMIFEDYIKPSRRRGLSGDGDGVEMEMEMVFRSTLGLCVCCVFSRGQFLEERFLKERLFVFFC